MAYSTIYFENPRTGQVKSAPVGFSWTVLFFGFFPPLFRSHWVGFAILLILGFFTWGLSNLVFMFIYNKMYIKYLVGEGYKATDADIHLEVLERKLNMPLPRLPQK